MRQIISRGFCAAALFLIVGLFTGLFCSSLHKKTVIVFIRSGLSTRNIADTLYRHGVIDNPQKFRILARIFGFDKRLRQGRYEFGHNTEELFVLWKMSRPGRTGVRVTIPEGFTMQKIAEILEAQGVCSATDFLRACQDRLLLDSLGISLNSAEGYLFPDTYEFEIGAEPSAVIERMVRRFRAVWKELVMSEETADSAPSSLNVSPSTVILASIVEREAVQPEEAPIIAGIFRNRLARGMPLQSCATVEYILPVHKKRLTLEDTRIDSPYNTYLHSGLPPGPICNPGRTALAAALRPESTEYLYFLSRGDGTHIFSKTWHEHEAARRRQNREQEWRGGE